MVAEKKCEEEAMEMMSSSFRLEGSSWRKIERSNSSLLASELVGSEIAKVVAYERLSSSMRLTANDYSTTRRHNKINRGWSFLVKAFSFRKRGKGQVVKAAAEAPEVAVDKKKKKTIWFPDPHRRWPVQGW